LLTPLGEVGLVDLVRFWWCLHLWPFRGAVFDRWLPVASWGCTVYRSKSFLAPSHLV